MMRGLNLGAPRHLTEALRTNISGGKTVRKLLAEAASAIPFMSLEELSRRIGRQRNDFVILDVRERDDYGRGHVPVARTPARGQLGIRMAENFHHPALEIERKHVGVGRGESVRVDFVGRRSNL